MLFRADFITYKGIYRTIETEKLNIPTSEGRRTILSNHMPIMLPITVGVIETAQNGVLSHYAINRGVLYFENNVAEIVADSIVDVKEIDVDLASREKQKYEERIAASRDENEINRAKQRLEINLNLLQAAEKYRREV